jgi:transposase
LSYPSSEIDHTGRISKIGDGSLRSTMPPIVLAKPLKSCSQLTSFAMRIARRTEMSKAEVDLAGRLAASCIARLPKNPFNAAAV